MNLIKIRWLASDQVHPLVGDMRKGEDYDVPEDLGKAWIDQGVADHPQTAEAHKVARGGKATGKDKE